jgi:thermitase
MSTQAGLLDPDVLLHDPGGPRECLVRTGQLVVPDDAVEPAMRALDRWVDHVEVSAEARLATLRLRPDLADRCVELAAEAGRRLPVAPNHVHSILYGTPILHGTGAAPQPVPPPPAPAEERWQPPVTVAILDTGLDPHPWFAGRPWLSDWGLQPEVLDSDGDSRRDRLAGHGTFVAGVLLQHAPGVTIRHRRVLSSQGIADDRTVAAALRSLRRRAAAAGEHLDIVLLTAGCHTVDNRCPPLLAREISRFTDTVFVAAAGNSGTARPFWPAAASPVVAVGATDRPGHLAPFSNRGPWLDTTAPGVNIVSSFVQFRPSAGLAPDTEPRTYGAARWTGTSFAAPHIAADIANLLHTGLSTHDARRIVVTK